MSLSGNYMPDSAAGYLIVTSIVEADPGLNNYKLRVALTESSINWHAPNGTQIHNQTFRDMIPYASGLGITVAEGDTIVDTLRFTTRSPEVLNNLYLIAFIQADQNRQVIQSAKIKVSAMIDPEGIDDHTNRPAQFTLAQNYPNPFNSQTRIDFVSSGGNTKLDIFDLTGAKVASLIDRNLDAGAHSIIWDGRDSQGKPVSSGTYFYRLKDSSRSDIKRMTLLK
jgi:hypothetical protein